MVKYIHGTCNRESGLNATKLSTHFGITLWCETDGYSLQQRITMTMTMTTTTFHCHGQIGFGAGGCVLGRKIRWQCLCSVANACDDKAFFVNTGFAIKKCVKFIFLLTDLNIFILTGSFMANRTAIQSLSQWIHNMYIHTCLPANPFVFSLHFENYFVNMSATVAVARNYVVAMLWAMLLCVTAWCGFVVGQVDPLLTAADTWSCS